MPLAGVVVAIVVADPVSLIQPLRFIDPRIGIHHLATSHGFAGILRQSQKCLTTVLQSPRSRSTTERIYMKRAYPSSRDLTCKRRRQIPIVEVIQSSIAVLVIIVVSRFSASCCN